MFFKKLKIYSIIVLSSLLLGIISFEIFSSYRKDLFPSYGWLANNIMKDKVKNCQRERNIGVFGDSFVEYYGDKKINITRILEKKFENYNVCNFGKSGTEITDYINRFLHVLDNNVKMEKAIFYFYEGNDFAEFRYLKKNKNFNKLRVGDREVFNYSGKKIFDRKLSKIKQFVKSTNSLNVIYREVIKKYFFQNKIDENYVKNIYSEKKYFEVSLMDAIEIMNKTPNKYKKLLSAYILNKNFYNLAIRNPNYFNEIYSPDNERYEAQKKIAFKHINFINNLCKENNIECGIIIIPADQFLFKEAKEKYTNLFRFNHQQDIGKSKIVTDIIKNYKNIFYPESIFQYDDYIINDMHLTGSGNEKLANFTYDKFG